MAWWQIAHAMICNFVYQPLCGTSKAFGEFYVRQMWWAMQHAATRCSASKPYSFFQKSKRQDRSFSNIKSRIIEEKIWSIVVKRKGDFLWLLDGGQIACKRVHTYFTWPTQSELGQAADMTGGQLSIEKPTFSLLIYLFYTVTFD